MNVQKQDILTRVNVWQLEGEREHDSLLKFAVNKDNFHKLAIMITLDFSKPWDIVDSLKKWLETLEKHIKDNKLTTQQSKTNRTFISQKY